jgi:hypothetical protein
MRNNPEEQFPSNSSPSPVIPPLPEMAGAMPPPLPKPQVMTTSGKKTVLMALGAMVVLLIGAVVAGVGLFWVTKRDLEVTPEYRAALHTAADLAEWYEFEVDPSCEKWTGERLFDGAVEIGYEYDDPRDEAPYLNASLHYEPKESDSRINFGVLWQSATLGVSLGDESQTVEEVKGLYSWGDASRLGFFTSGGERHGLLFCARKGKKVYFLMTGGVCMEEAEDLKEFLEPKLDAVERLNFGRK